MNDVVSAPVSTVGSSTTGSSGNAQSGDLATPMVDLKNVHLTLGSAAGQVNILRGIDLSIPAGQTASIVGPSGSGKTTLLMVIGGLERPSEGTISVAGTELGGLDENRLALFRRSNLGIVFQAFHLVPTMTALENVAVPLELSGRSDAFDRARESLDKVGLSHRITHYPGQLSGGEQQRVALARAFAVEPKLLLADEPTGNLDGENGRHIIDLMFDLSARSGSTLVLITHDVGLAKTCDRVIRIADGRVEGDELMDGKVAVAGGAR